MVSFPPCKINLGLHILSKRTDGFHAIETAFYPVPWTDVLEVIPADDFAFTTSGSIIPGDSADNLCVIAYHLLKKKYNLPNVKIHLHKILPTGAGLGGGSSDAAHTLRLLDSVFDLQLSTEELQKYAAVLGSDCAFFVHDAPMLGTGRGEILEPLWISLKGKNLLLVTPSIHVSTREAYACVTPKNPRLPLAEILTMPLTVFKDHLVNDFEFSVFKAYPALQEIKNSLYAAGAIYASMSGSGSTLFGIFDHSVDLRSFQPHITWQAIL